MTNPLREEDQVIEEVRRARADLWRRAGGTAAGLVRLLSQPRPIVPQPTPGLKPEDDERSKDRRLSA
jgi:hypothetical protein